MNADKVGYVTKVDIDRDDFEEFVDVISEAHGETTFSTNPDESELMIWKFVGFGYTKMEDRYPRFEGKSNMLDHAALFLREQHRESGGRFRVSLRGAYCAANDQNYLEWKKSADLSLHIAQIRGEFTRRKTLASARDLVLRALLY